MPPKESQDCSDFARLLRRMERYCGQVQWAPGMDRRLAYQAIEIFLGTARHKLDDAARIATAAEAGSVDDDLDGCREIYFGADRLHEAAQLMNRLLQGGTTLALHLAS